MAVDWTLPRVQTGLRFVRVDYSTRQELEELTTVQLNGSITRNMNTELKEDGTLPVVDPDDLGDDLVRVYYEVEDSDGNEETVKLGTLHAVNTSRQYTPATNRSDLTLISALLTLRDSVITESLTIPAGTNALDYAVSICEALGLPVVYTDSDRVLTTDANWDAGTTKLSIVNYLLGFANHWSARVDTSGRVWFSQYVSPGERTAVWTFTAGENCTYLPDVIHQVDKFNVPNVCVVTMSTPDEVFSGSYENTDPDSPYSIANRGREIALVKTVWDGVDVYDLDDMAERDLFLATGETERLMIAHAYCPIRPGDVVRFVWEAQGIDMNCVVLSQQLNLNHAVMTQTTLKKVWSIA